MTEAPPPYPKSPDDQARWEHTGLRYRILYGIWKQDAMRRIQLEMGTLRTALIGIPDLSSVPFETISAECASLYDRTPVVSLTFPETTTAIEPEQSTMVGLLARSGLWPMMQRVQRDTIGMREMLVKVDGRVNAQGGVEIILTPVPPHRVRVVADPQDARRIGAIWHVVQREDRAGKCSWVWDCWDCRDRTHPTMRVEDNHGGDISAEYGLPKGGLRGDAYPWWSEDGEARIPFSLYHAALTGCIFDPYHGMSAVDATLSLSVLWSYAKHATKNASFIQRWAKGVRPLGSDNVGEGDAVRSQIEADPTLVLLLEDVLAPDGGPPGQSMVGQWSAPTDVEALFRAIMIFENKVGASLGVSAADITRSGDPRSGYALAVSNEGKREQKRKYEPIFGPVDLETIALVAIVHNTLAPAAVPLPETGWAVEYPGIPLSPEEKKAEREYVAGLLQSGAIDLATHNEMLGLPPPPKKQIEKKPEMTDAIEVSQRTQPAENVEAGDHEHG